MPLVWSHLEVGKLVNGAQTSRGCGWSLAGFHGFPATEGGSGGLLKSILKSLDGCLVMGKGGGGVWWCCGGGVGGERREESFLERKSEFG